MTASSRSGTDPLVASVSGFAAFPVISGIQDVVLDVVVDCGHAVVAVVDRGLHHKVLPQACSTCFLLAK